MYGQVARQEHVCFFGKMRLDLQRELPQLLDDIYAVSKRCGCLVYVEFAVISLYNEQGPRLDVIKIITEGNRRAKRVTKLVFVKPGTEPVERYTMIGTDNTIPIWKPDDMASEP